MSAADPHWTAYLSALLTPTVAVLGTFIAFQQWRTARNKLKFELFQRRLATYEAVQSFLGSIMTSGKVSDEALSKYAVGTAEVRWLYGSEVSAFLRESVWEKAVDLQCLHAELEGMPVGTERSANVKKQSEIKKYMFSLSKVVDDKFEPFLRLYH